MRPFYLSGNRPSVSEARAVRAWIADRVGRCAQRGRHPRVCMWVDAEGRLHLRSGRNRPSAWYAASQAWEARLDPANPGEAIARLTDCALSYNADRW